MLTDFFNVKIHNCKILSLRLDQHQQFTSHSSYKMNISLKKRNKYKMTLVKM